MTKICEKCGATLEEKDRICPKCGHTIVSLDDIKDEEDKKEILKVLEEEPAELTEEQKKDSKISSILGVLLIILPAPIGVYLVDLINNNVFTRIAGFLAIISILAGMFLLYRARIKYPKDKTSKRVVGGLIGITSIGIIIAIIALLIFGMWLFTEIYEAIYS